MSAQLQLFERPVVMANNWNPEYHLCEEPVGRDEPSRTWRHGEQPIFHSIEAAVQWALDRGALPTIHSSVNMWAGYSQSESA